MIPFRHHLVSLVAVFLALAVGVVLGGGPLSDVDRSVTDRVSAEAPDQATRAAAAYSDGFAAAAGPRLVAGRLADRSVVVVSMPGAEESTVQAVEELVAAAGGSVSGRYGLTEAMVDVSEKSLVDTLGSQLMAQQPEGTVDDGASTYDRIGQLLGTAIASPEAGGSAPDAKATGILEGLLGAELVTGPKAPDTRAPLVLVVLGERPAGEGADAITSGIATGLARSAVGAVVAGTIADGAGGQLEALRAETASSEVTSVDGVETAAGQSTTVLALAWTLEQSGGSFGASGEDGTAPLG